MMPNTLLIIWLFLQEMESLFLGDTGKKAGDWVTNLSPVEPGMINKHNQPSHGT